MDSRGRLILHAGMAKTGSSTIQQTLCADRWRNNLDSAGVRFLNAETNHSNYGPFFNALRRAPRWRAASEHQAVVENFAANIRRVQEEMPQGTTMLISAEAICDIARKPAVLKKTHDFLSQFFSEIQVAMYVREPLSYVCSRMQQDLKAGLPWEDALRLALESCDCTRSIQNLEDTFGKPLVTIRSFDQALLTSGDVLVDFTRHVLGIAETKDIVEGTPRIDVNKGVTQEVLGCLLRLYQEREVTRLNVKAKFIHLLRDIKWVGTKFDPSLFSGTEGQHLSDVTDSARSKMRARLGFDPFPSYRQFAKQSPPVGESQRLDILTRNTHLIADAIVGIARRRREAPPDGLDQAATTPLQAEEQLYRLLSLAYEMS